MSNRYRALALLILTLAVACQDAGDPLTAPQASVATRTGTQRLGMLGMQAYQADDSAPAHLVRQDPSAPPLATYQVSFWVRRDRETSVTVNYQPAAGQSTGQPFMWFDVPKDALGADAAGNVYRGRDSVLITATIDTVNFLVDFEPSGLTFKHDKPAVLVFWYQNANPDLNGDGVVNAVDDSLRRELHIVTRPVPGAHWHWTKSFAGWSLPYVYADIRHFSQYAVSW